MTVESIEASIASEWARRRGAAQKDDAKLRVMFVPTIISAARKGREAVERNHILHCLSVRKRIVHICKLPQNSLLSVDETGRVIIGRLQALMDLVLLK